MKALEVTCIEFPPQTSIETVSATLDTLQRHKIDQQPWKEFDYQPNVNFSIAHTGSTLFLKYYVSESTVRAFYFRPNEPVYKDSCVEFFIALNGDKRYYNFEFNSIGTCKLNFGPSRDSRQLISEKAISNITFISSITNNTEDGNLRWEITISIPLSSFTEHKLTSFEGCKCRGNFYKCGDELPRPHFLSWNNIIAPVPDFHVPESFGDIAFQ
jgi:hypothetical protein